MFKKELEKLQLILYLASIVIFLATAFLLVLNGHIRDSYNIMGEKTVDSAALFLTMIGMVFMLGVLLAARFFSKCGDKYIAVGLIIAISLFLFGIYSVVTNAIQLKHVHDRYTAENVTEELFY